jgi:hypothetical protein
VQKIGREFVDVLLRNSLNIYHYGSFVYGTFVEGISDYDYIVVVPEHMGDLDEQQFECNNCQYTIHSEKSWQEMLDRCDVDALETYFLPEQYIVKETVVFVADITKTKVRNSFSHVASNSFVKCKKKLEVAESYNPAIGKKSLWHSLRILDFGVQILEHGKVINYGSMNWLYAEIVRADEDDWEYFKTKYKPMYNALKSKFRAC